MGADNFRSENICNLEERGSNMLLPEMDVIRCANKLLRAEWF